MADIKDTCPTCGVLTKRVNTVNGMVWETHLNKQRQPCVQSGRKA